MAGDIAALGFGVDSSALERGVSAVKKFTRSATDAAGKTNAVTSAIEAAEQAMTELRSAANNAAAGMKNVGQSEAAISKAASAARQLDNVMSGLSGARKAQSAMRAAAGAAESQATANLKAAQAAETVSAEDVAAAKAALAKAQADRSAAKASIDKTNAAMSSISVIKEEVSAQMTLAGASRKVAAGSRGNFQSAMLAAQGFDVATTAAMGMNAAMIGMQQGTQIAQQAMASEGNFLKEVAKGFGAMLSPMTLAIIGLTTLAAVLIQNVNWSGVATSALNTLADWLPSIAEGAAIAAAALALMYAPALIGGIGSVISLVGSLSAAAVRAAASFISAWAAALGPFGLIVAAIGAALTAAYVFRDEIEHAIGIDVVGTVKNAVNAIIAAFVGGFNGIKETWSLLPAALGDLVISTANTVISGVESMVNKVSEKIDSYIAKINSMVKSLPWGIGDKVQIGTIGTFDFGSIPNPYEGSANDVSTAVSAAISEARKTDYLGEFGNTISQGARKGAAALKELAAGLASTGETAKSGGAKAKEGFDAIVASAERAIAANKADAAAVGLSDEAALKLRYTQQLLNEAKQKGIALSQAQTVKLRELASQMATTKVQADNAKSSFSFFQSTAKGFFSDLYSNLRNGKSVWEAFSDAAMKALDKIVDKLLNDVIDALTQVNSTTQSGTGIWGSITSAVSGFFGGFAANAKGGVYSGAGISAYSNAIVSRPTVFPFAKGTGLMGEAGPEAIMPLIRDSSGRLGVRSLSGNDNYRAANQNQHVHVTSDVQIQFDNDGFKSYVEKTSTSQAAGVVSQAAPAIVKQSTQSSGDALAKGKYAKGMKRYGSKRRANVG